MPPQREMDRGRISLLLSGEEALVTSIDVKERNASLPSCDFNISASRCEYDGAVCMTAPLPMHDRAVVAMRRTPLSLDKRDHADGTTFSDLSV